MTVYRRLLVYIVRCDYIKYKDRNSISSSVLCGVVPVHLSYIRSFNDIYVHLVVHIEVALWILL